MEVVESSTSDTYVTHVKGLSPGSETQFVWTVTRWGCVDSEDVFVYYNKVEADAGPDIYTCDDMAQLQATEPAAGSGRWDRTKASAPGVRFGKTADDQNKTEFSTEPDSWVFGLVQDDNPFAWTVENPIPPDDSVDPDNDNVFIFKGHPYEKRMQRSCPTTDETTVHNLKPDPAVITTGDKIQTPPGP